MAATRRNWMLVAPGILSAERTFAAHRSPAIQASLDQSTARLRDQLDFAGICLADDEQAHEALFLGLLFLNIYMDRLHRASRQWHRPEIFAGGRAVYNAMVASLLEYLPGEARSGP